MDEIKLSYTKGEEVVFEKTIYVTPENILEETESVFRKFKLWYEYNPTRVSETSCQ